MNSLYKFERSDERHLHDHDPQAAESLEGRTGNSLGQVLSARILSRLWPPADDDEGRDSAVPALTSCSVGLEVGSDEVR